MGYGEVTLWQRSPLVEIEIIKAHINGVRFSPMEQLKGAIGALVVTLIRFQAGPNQLRKLSDNEQKRLLKMKFEVGKKYFKVVRGRDGKRHIWPFECLRIGEQFIYFSLPGTKDRVYHIELEFKEHGLMEWNDWAEMLYENKF